MGTKTVQISDDQGANWYTLPGSSGEWNDDGEQITDTIFGQNYQSSQPGLITWNGSANAVFKGFAGYVASLKRSGTATSMTGEATTNVSGKTYRINDAAKRIMDYTQSITVLDNASPVSASDIETINYLFGSVTFVDDYTVTGAITITGNYLPMSEISKANTFTLTQTVDPIDHTDFETANSNDGYRVFEPGLKTVGLELGGFFDATEAFWETLANREDIIIEINPDGSGLSLARGVFKMISRGQSGDVGALEEETRTFGLSVPEDVDIIYDWQHDPSTTLSTSIRRLVTAFVNDTTSYVRYLPDGVDEIGFSGEAVVTDLSLSSGLDAMNDFTVSFQGSGTPTRGIQSD